MSSLNATNGRFQVPPLVFELACSLDDSRGAFPECVVARLNWAWGYVAVLYGSTMY